MYVQYADMYTTKLPAIRTTELSACGKGFGCEDYECPLCGVGKEEFEEE